MKKIFKTFCFAAALSAAFSCSNLNVTPAFEDSKSFAAFDVTSVTVDENAGTVSIPVTIASLEPKAVAVAYVVEDGTAKAGENYSLVDDSAVLTFDGKTRTQNIVINITDLAGKYTGDLGFTITLVKPGSLNLGASSVCTVKISDLDHPLADILGTYVVTATDFAQGDVTWEMTLTKDESDVTMVWIDYVCPLAKQGSMAVYANVSEDHKTISIPCGQEVEDGLTFVEYEYDNGHYATKTGSVDMVSTTPGVFTTEKGIGMIEGNSLYGGGVLIQGTTVWTKK